MEIQYAIFCANVEFPDEPQGAVVLTKPLSAISLKGAKGGEMHMPLFTTFINGVAGSGHSLDVKVTKNSGEILSTRDFKFQWRGTAPTQAECFIVKLPCLRSSDLLTFALVLDGKEQCKMKIPIKITG